MIKQLTLKLTLCLTLCVTMGMADEAEKFFYERGFENGWNQGFDAGVNKGIEIAKKVVEKYKNRVRAFEVGKYLIEEKHLTYPQIYQVLNEKDGMVTFQILPSRMEKELNIDDIFAQFGELPNGEEKKEMLLSDLNNSVMLSSRDSNTYDVPSPANRDSNIIYMKVSKTSENHKTLRNANLVYIEEKKHYKVMFFNKNEKQAFCAQHKKVCK